MQEILRRAWALFTFLEPSYYQTDVSMSKVFGNHASVLTSFWRQTNDEELDFAIHLLDSKVAQKSL